MSKVMKIQRLDPITANHIAAGEVVERPSSVVKELCENAIDAGASQIEVLCLNGGIKKIQVSDNGIGMTADDALAAFERHATSKLRKIEDLDELTSMGFRGEALAAISSVSKTTLVTRPEAQELGTRVYIEGGELIEHLPIACAAGSTFLIEDLFYNTPARYKFLKSDKTEAARIHDFLTQLALAHPHIGFKLSQNQSVGLQTPGNGDLLSCAYALFGKKVCSELLLLPETGDGQQLRLEGAIGKPNLARKSRQHQYVLVNGRAVRSAIVTKALEEAYRDYLMKGQHPFAILHLHVPPHLVDVNVHPQKLELRFWNDKDVFQFVYHAVREGLSRGQGQEEALASDQASILHPTALNSSPASARTTASSQMDSPIPASQERTYDTSSAVLQTVAMSSTSVPSAVEPISESSICLEELPQSYVASPVKTQKSDALFRWNTTRTEASLSPLLDCLEENQDKVSGLANQASQNLSLEETSATSAVLGKTLPPELDELKRSSYAGKAFDTYLFFQSDQSLFWVDQHAAHERILYEKLLSEETDLPQEALLETVFISLKPRELSFLEDERDHFEQLGFTYDLMGSDQILLRTAPMLSPGDSAEELFLATLDELMQLETGLQLAANRETLRIRVATKACKAAIKAHDQIKEEEAIRLIQDLVKLENPYQCPHGRPTFLRYSLSDIEKLFKRIV